MHGFTIGSSWVAQAVGSLLGIPVVPLSRAAIQELYTAGPVKATIIHADSQPPETTAYNRWRWMFQALSARIVWREAYWIQLSTLRVLTGSHYQRPYKASDPVQPLDITGQIMASLEWGVLSLGYPAAVVRTGLLYDRGYGPVLPWLLGLANSDAPSTVAAEIVSPTSIADLCQAIQWLIKNNRVGVFHAANSGQTSYQHLAHWLAKELGRPKPKLREVTAGVGLANLSVTSNIRLRSWKDAMRDTLADLTGS